MVNSLEQTVSEESPIGLAITIFHIIKGIVPSNVRVVLSEVIGNLQKYDEHSDHKQYLSQAAYLLQGVLNSYNPRTPLTQSARDSMQEVYDALIQR